MAAHLFRHPNLFFVILIVLAAWFITPVMAEVFIEPYGVAVSLGADEESSRELRLVNKGENDVTFNVNCVVQANEFNDRGPRRDDLGEDIAQYQIGGNVWAGLAWDGELMWGVEFNSGLLCAFDLAHDGDS